MRRLFRFSMYCLMAAGAALSASCDDDDPKSGGGDKPGEAISLTAAYALGGRSQQAADDRSTEYRMLLSEGEVTGTVDEPQFTAAGNYVTLVLNAAPQEEGILPEGSYKLVGSEPAAGKGSIARCRYGTADPSNSGGGKRERLLEGTVTVAHAGTGYRIELSARLTQRRTLNCVYEGEIEFVNLDPEPDPDPDPTYDVSITASHAMGSIYAEVTEDGSSEFYVLLSDVALEGNAEEPIFGGAGKFAVLDLCAIPLEEGMLPEGEYEFVADIPSNMQGTLDYSGYGETDASGEPTADEPVYFSDCTATVAYTDDGYKIEATGTLEDGRTFRFLYEGFFEFEDNGGGEPTLPGLPSDVNTTFTLPEASYLGETNVGTAMYILDLWDNDIDQHFKTTNRLSLTLFTALSDNPLALAPGTYTVALTGAAGTLLPGELNLETFQIIGSYCEQTLIEGADYSLLYGMIDGGTVTIAAAGNGYTLTADLTDTEGHAIKGTFTGDIPVADESFFSTLEGDKQANLAGMPCDIIYYADYYGVRGDNWSLYIGTGEDGTEAFQIELVAPMTGFEAGLPAGEYTVTDLNAYPSGGRICVPGVYSGQKLYESWFMGDFQGGITYSIAPFASGKVTVSRSGEQYTIEVDVLDDAPTPHRVTGSWTGTPTITDDSAAQSAPGRFSRKSAPAKSAKCGLSVREGAVRHAVSVENAVKAAAEGSNRFAR